MRRVDLRRVLVSAVVLAGAAAGIHQLCVIPFRANLVMHDVEKRMAAVESAGLFRPSSLAHQNLTDLERVARSGRLDPAWYMFYGANCEALERWQDAAGAYTDALAIAQRPEIYFSRGLVRLHLGQIEPATADMVTAVRFNPFFVERLDGELRTRVAAEAGLP